MDLFVQPYSQLYNLKDPYLKKTLIIQSPLYTYKINSSRELTFGDFFSYVIEFIDYLISSVTLSKHSLLEFGNFCHYYR